MGRTTEIARMIDHSILHPTHTREDLQRGCELSVRFGVASLCVKPCSVKWAVAGLEGSGIPVASVIGFPHGNNRIDLKVQETTEAIEDGAREIDMVLNIAKVLEEDWEYVREEIASVVGVTKREGALLKVIFETDYLPTDALKMKLCEICTELAVDFVKTSTGFGYVKDEQGHLVSRGATVKDIELMRKHSGKEVRVKASGGIRSLDQLLEMEKAGASRIGTSATEAILHEAAKRFGKDG